jgi:hypothetical protein
MALTETQYPPPSGKKTKPRTDLFYKPGYKGRRTRSPRRRNETVVFETAIFVGQSEDGTEVGSEVSQKVKSTVSRYSGPSGLRLIVCPARHVPKSAYHTLLVLMITKLIAERALLLHFACCCYHY